jgi:transcriptional regulator with AAA-type ATPase domain
MKSTEIKPFNKAAQARVQALFRTCTPETFLSQLATYLPRTTAEQAAYSKYTGWALSDAGDYEICRPYLMAAHRLSDNRSYDRPLTLALLASTYLHTGNRARSTRIALRALSEGCNKDPGHRLEASLTLILAQSQALSGNLGRSVEMCDRARSLIDMKDPILVAVLHSRAKANVYRGRLPEANADCREARMCEAAFKQQTWAIDSMEFAVALEMGDFEQADEILRQTVASYAGESSGRMQTTFTNMQGDAMNARGHYDEAEPLLREVLENAVLGGQNSDVVAGASCSLTEALVGQNRFEEALETSRLAARAGNRLDWEVWVRALRYQAQCHIGLGSKRRAEGALRKAEALHAFTEYGPERTRLDEVARLLRPNSSRGADLAWIPRSRGVWRLSLPSGRALISCDTQLEDAISAAAGTDLPVLIEGETGTGKELVANMIHELSPRSRYPFVVIDCSSLPESLADAELFGVARGAFTGADAHRAGLIAQADQGTLVLDELPELSNALQAKLLRVIQEGMYRRVGEDQPRRVHARFIAITNRDTNALLQTRALRADLFYRLNGHRLAIRPLRERPEDIAPIANEIAKRSGLEGVTMAAARLLERHSWPGNVRQLEMVVRLAASFCLPGSLLGKAHLAPHLFDQPHDPTESPLIPEVRGSGLRSNRLAGERLALEKALMNSGGSVTKAARALGVTRQSFYQAMHRVGMKPGDWRDGETGKE